MNIPLSKRLQACAEQVLPGNRVADIGCDHGYLSIYLLTKGIASSVIAADINKMPLQSSVRNAEKFGVQDNISFYLSDGVKNIPRDFDVMICAGMGADTMISILEAAPWLKCEKYQLILQCQSKLPSLRKFLSDNNYHIQRETVLRDGRFLYTVISAQWDPAARPLTQGQVYFPLALLTDPTPELPEYYQSTLFRLRRAISGQGENASPAMCEALKELENNPDLSWLKEKHDDNC